MLIASLCASFTLAQMPPPVGGGGPASGGGVETPPDAAYNPAYWSVSVLNGQSSGTGVIKQKTHSGVFEQVINSPEVQMINSTSLPWIAEGSCNGSMTFRVQWIYSSPAPPEVHVVKSGTAMATYSSSLMIPGVNGYLLESMGQEGVMRTGRERVELEVVDGSAYLTIAGGSGHSGPIPPGVTIECWWGSSVTVGGHAIGLYSSIEDEVDPNDPDDLPGTKHFVPDPGLPGVIDVGLFRYRAVPVVNNNESQRIAHVGFPAVVGPFFSRIDMVLYPKKYGQFYNPQSYRWSLGSTEREQVYTVEATASQLIEMVAGPRSRTIELQNSFVDPLLGAQTVSASLELVEHGPYEYLEKDYATIVETTPWSSYLDNGREVRQYLPHAGDVQWIPVNTSGQGKSESVVDWKVSVPFEWDWIVNFGVTFEFGPPNKQVDTTVVTTAKAGPATQDGEVWELKYSLYKEYSRSFLGLYGRRGADATGLREKLKSDPSVIVAFKLASVITGP